MIRGFFNAVDIRQEGLIQLEDLVGFLDDARDLRGKAVQQDGICFRFLVGFYVYWS